MRDEVEVERIIEFRWNECFEDFVRLLAGGFLRNPTEPFGHAKNMRVYRKPGQDGSKVYRIY